MHEKRITSDNWSLAFGAVIGAVLMGIVAGWLARGECIEPALCCKCPADLDARLTKDEWKIPTIENCIEGVNDEALDAQADAAWCKAKIDEQQATIECLRVRLDAIEEWKPWLLWAAENLKPRECECCRRGEQR